MLSIQPVTWAASVLTTVTLPRLLSADALGQLTIAFTISGLASTATGLGITDFMVRRAAQQPGTLRRDAGAALALQSITALVAAFAIFTLGPMLTSSFLDPRLLIVMLVPMLGTPVQNILLASLRGQEAHARYAWFNAGGTVVSAVVGVLVLAAGGDVVASVGVASALVIAFNVVAWKYSGVGISLSFDRSVISHFWELARGGLPFVAWQLTLVAYGQVDKLIMGGLVPTMEVGWYAAAYRIIGVVVFVPTLVITPLFPALSRCADDRPLLRRTVAQTIRLLLLLMIGMAAGTIVVASAVPSLLGWPSDYEHAVPLMMILAVHEPLVAIDMVLGVVLMAIHRERPWVVVGVLATAFNVASNYVAIPFFEHLLGDGAAGASITTVLTEILMFAGAVYLIPKSVFDPKLISQGARLALAGVAAVAVGFTSLHLTVFIAGPAAAITYIGVVMLLHVVTVEDLDPVRARFAGLAH